MTIKDDILLATDDLARLKRLYYQSGVSYDDTRAAAVRVLTLRQQAELAFSGKVKTKITAAAIASLIR